MAYLQRNLVRKIQTVLSLYSLKSMFLYFKLKQN